MSFDGRLCVVFVKMQKKYKNIEKSYRNLIQYHICKMMK